MKSIDIDIRKSKDLNIDMSRGSASLEIGVSKGGGGTKDYNKLINKPSINGVELVGNKTGQDLDLVSVADLSDALAIRDVYTPKIFVDTTANWNAQTTLRTEEKTVYVYTDYQVTSDGTTVA